MRTIIANEEWTQRLHAVEQITEIRDANGHLLGYFTPLLTGTEEGEKYARALANADPERLVTANVDQTGGVPLAGFFDFLRSLEPKTCASR